MTVDGIEIPDVVIANPPQVFLLHDDGTPVGWLFSTDDGVIAVKQGQIIKTESLADFVGFFAPIMGAEVARVTNT
ncbi:hypothetical protein ACFQZ8_00930 [Micromonospora azadirachtae]|uniref:Uncharacterized protein n=1 Tax=Micromonospora azadirachtae TaxID=1970735 RepID=A0ABW2ZVD7_9ACTN